MSQNEPIKTKARGVSRQSKPQIFPSGTAPMRSHAAEQRRRASLKKVLSGKRFRPLTRAIISIKTDDLYRHSLGAILAPTQCRGELPLPDY